MKIGELAQRTGVNERLLRYYEEQGLLQPQRLQSGYRSYEETDAVIVSHIRSLLRAGLTTSVIRRLLPCLNENHAEPFPVCSEIRSQLATECVRIDDSLKELRASRRLLQRMVDAAVLAGP